MDKERNQVSRTDANAKRAARKARLARLDRIRTQRDQAEMQRRKAAELAMKQAEEEVAAEQVKAQKTSMKEYGKVEYGKVEYGKVEYGKVELPSRRLESRPFQSRKVQFDFVAPRIDSKSDPLGWDPAFSLFREQDWLGEGSRRVELPRSLRSLGWRQVSRAVSLNAPIQIESPDGQRYWVKQEQSSAAASAEVETSAFYRYVGWRGCNLIFHGNLADLVISPALGGPNLRDLGSVGDLFPDRSERDGIRASRSWVLSRIHLAELRLQDPRDVVSFLTYNAIFANTDRHSGNLHLGEILDHSGFSLGNVLLPIDHGRCLTANTVWNKYITPAHTPLDIIIGAEIGLQSRNPHQLLRPFVEFSELYPDDVEYLIELAVANVVSFLDYGALANGILLSPRSIEYMRDNVDWLRTNVSAFVAGCQEVVMRGGVSS